MIQSDSTFSTQTTIYSYKLLKKIQHSVYATILYLVLILLLVVVDINEGLWWLFVISYPLVFILHSLVVWMYFYFTVGGFMRGWSFHWGVFWNGILPEGHASIRLVQKVQLHLLWIGLILIGGLFPWINIMLWVNLLLFHLWVMIPRLFIFLRFHAYHKNGLIRISQKDTSCYLP